MLVTCDKLLYDVMYQHSIVCVTWAVDEPVNVKPNVFDKILSPASEMTSPNALQLELHYRSVHHRYYLLITAQML